MIEFLKAVLFGVVEGITEWLPISSTGHMILLDEFVKLDVSENFWNLFLVVIQLGAILAVVILFWKKIWPFQMPNKAEKKPFYKKDIWSMWFKMVVACIPAILFAAVGLDDICDKYFYNGIGVSIALIVFGVAFILIENWNKKRTPKIKSLGDIGYRVALLIGIFQILAAAFPGTSRSGATIIGALLIGVSRVAASEFTFILSIPAMLGASLLELKDYLGVGMKMSPTEVGILIIGVIVAFLVSVVVIKFLMSYIRKHDFKVFGWYRIVLGVIVLLYFLIK